MKKEKRVKKNSSVVILLFVGMILISLTFISAAETDSKIVDFVKKMYQNYLVPQEGDFYFGDIENETSFAIITIIGLIVFVSIIFEFSFMMPFSTFTNSIIAIGAIVIFISVKAAPFLCRSALARMQ